VGVVGGDEPPIGRRADADAVRGCGRRLAHGVRPALRQAQELGIAAATAPPRAPARGRVDREHAMSHGGRRPTATRCRRRGVDRYELHCSELTPAFVDPRCRRLPWPSGSTTGCPGRDHHCVRLQDAPPQHPSLNLSSSSLASVDCKNWHDK
jgi:hypothetical protein